MTTLPIAVHPILLPTVDKSKFAVIACDQYTSEPEYWKSVETIVGNSPSALRLIIPEIYLGQENDKIENIHAEMQNYLEY